MILTIEAVFENGVFKPVQPLPLQEQEQVLLTVRTGQAWVEQTAGRRRGLKGGSNKGSGRGWHSADRSVPR